MDNKELVKHLDKKFESIDKRFDKVDERFDKMDSRFNKVDQRFNKMDSRFNTQDKSIDNIAAQVVKNSENIEDIKRNMVTKDELRNVISTIENMAKKLDDLHIDHLAAIEWLKRHEKEINHLKFQPQIA